MGVMFAKRFQSNFSKSAQVVLDETRSLIDQIKARKAKEWSKSPQTMTSNGMCVQNANQSQDSNAQEQHPEMPESESSECNITLLYGLLFVILVAAGALFWRLNLSGKELKKSRTRNIQSEAGKVEPITLIGSIQNMFEPEPPEPEPVKPFRSAKQVLAGVALTAATGGVLYKYFEKQGLFDTEEETSNITGGLAAGVVAACVGGSALADRYKDNRPILEFLGKPWTWMGSFLKDRTRDPEGSQ